MTKPVLARVRIWGKAEIAGAVIFLFNLVWIPESAIVEHSSGWAAVHAILAIFMAVAVQLGVRSNKRRRAVRQREYNEALENYERGER